MVNNGETVITSPVPAVVSPQAPVNHSVIAPDPFDPPVTVSMVFPPLQIAVTPLIPVGAVDVVLTVILALAGDVSEAGILSTCAFTVAIPPVPFDVNNAVAVPLA